MKEYLFLFTIGPVKDFIADSRKAQDLFAGSALLSYLTKGAIIFAKKVMHTGNPEIITPNEETPFKPNRFVLKLNSDGIDLAKVGKELEDYVRQLFVNIGEIPFKTKSKPNGYKNQLEDYLEISWLFYPIKDGDYRTAYKNLFIELSAQKNVNAFKNIHETGRKCSVDGKLNVKVYRKSCTYNHKEKKLIEEDIQLNGEYYSKLSQKPSEVEVIERLDENLLKIWHLEEGEGLSAVSLVKRIFNSKQPDKLSKTHVFPSTTNVSLMNWLAKVKDIPEFQKYERKVICNIKNKKINLFEHSNDQLYYPDNIRQIVDKIDTDKTNTALDFHKEMADAIKNAGITEPLTKYYALMRFDGDNMGDWLSGEWIKEDKDLEEYHKVFTNCVHQFATKVATYLKKPRGQVIYAGGEDFMALVNIHHLFNVLGKIRKLYKEEINDVLTTYKKEVTREMTISVGVAIAHYKQPLPMVLDRAKEMESKAKKGGRNRYAIGVMKHSGNALEMVSPWEVNRNQTLILVGKIQKSIEEGWFSTAFLRNLYNIYEEYGYDVEDYLIESKIMLYVPRGANNFATKEEKLKQIDKMIQTTTSLYSCFGKPKNEEFANLMLILDFLIRKSRS